MGDLVDLMNYFLREQIKNSDREDFVCEAIENGFIGRDTIPIQEIQEYKDPHYYCHY